MKPSDYLNAARVPNALQPQEFGLWSIQRKTFSRETKAGAIQIALVGWPSQTILLRMTEATLHLDGVIVMEDGVSELRRHLPIWLAARGRVLVTGLGLGCVLRGLLAKPEVEHVDVIEIDADIIRVVGAEFDGNPRAAIHHGNALTMQWPAVTRWDYAWHDLWIEQENKLQLDHMAAMLHFKDQVPKQGAWAFPKFIKRRSSMLLG